MGKKHNKEVQISDLKDACDWVDKNCSFGDVRNRMASRKVAWILRNALLETVDYIAQLKAKNIALEAMVENYKQMVKEDV